MEKLQLEYYTIRNRGFQLKKPEYWWKNWTNVCFFVKINIGTLVGYRFFKIVGKVRGYFAGQRETDSRK